MRTRGGAQIEQRSARVRSRRRTALRARDSWSLSDCFWPSASASRVCSSAEGRSLNVSPSMFAL
eukprot:3841868-Rhodomonas_salina.2